ncbi:hypothetical protein EVG20_g628 [Dentipellis fragilis]|uniref:Uncharacterized protein n=1 Tax=Dentipellis fragilis TaxID=205917 RepID=A0A4Y9ZF33_9AGAM|nr:hypothetical protein EVG20_g628 [Dentipellis fragilis]
MASQHSLPYSSSVPTINPANRPSQLPSSLSTVGISTRFENAASPGRLRSGKQQHLQTAHACAHRLQFLDHVEAPPVSPPPERPPVAAVAHEESLQCAKLCSCRQLDPRGRDSALRVLLPSLAPEPALVGRPLHPTSPPCLRPLAQDIIYDSDASGSVAHLPSELAGASGRVSRSSSAFTNASRARAPSWA